MEINNIVQSISEDQSKTVKERIDELLAIDKANHTNIGIDTSKDEKKEIYAQSRIIYKAIKGLDKETGDLFLRTSDK